jgi:hypothetical protein
MIAVVASESRKVTGEITRGGTVTGEITRGGTVKKTPERRGPEQSQVKL